jgi:hypothetical protein
MASEDWMQCNATSVLHFNVGVPAAAVLTAPCCAVLSGNNCVVSCVLCHCQDVIKFQPLLRTMGAQIARVRNMTAFLAAAL